MKTKNVKQPSKESRHGGSSKAHAHLSKGAALPGILLAVVMLFALAACAPSQEKQTDPKAVLAMKKLALVNSSGDDDYYDAFGKAFLAVAKAYGCEEIEEADSDYEAEEELAKVKEMISAGCDAIVVISAKVEGSYAAIAEANAANIPIFYCGPKPRLKEGLAIQGHVTCSYPQMGYMAGQWVAKNYPDAKCVTIPGSSGQKRAEGEVVGFAKALKEADMNELSVLAGSKWNKEGAVKVAEALVDSGQEFDVVFAANDEIALGIIEVLDERGIDIKQYADDGKTGKVVVSNNCSEKGREAIEEGTLAISVPNPPTLTADLCVQQIVACFSGKEYMESVQIAPPFVVDKKNAGEGISWDADTYMQQRESSDIVWELAEYEAAYEEVKDQLAELDYMVNEYLKTGEL